MRDLARALIMNGKITTTQAKAKSLKVYAEKLITKGKTKSLTTTRLLASQLGSTYAKKVTNEFAEKFATRNGGYTRIINMPRRISDGSKMAVIEFVN